jgi:hypothetical protein
MDWSKVKSAIGQIAPWIAGSFGTPAMGVAVSGLCSILGLDSKNATPDSISAAMAGATPEQLLALKQSDLKHQEFMAQLGYDSLTKLAQATVDDRTSARLREVQTKDSTTPRVLAALSIIAFGCLLYYVSNGSTPNQAMHDTFMLLTGAAVALVKDVYGYYFGSSAGSQAKDETISKLSQ